MVMAERETVQHETGKKSVDDLYNRLGDPGRYQVIIFFLTCMHFGEVATTNIISAVLAYSPDHECFADELPTKYDVSSSENGTLPGHQQTSAGVTHNVSRSTCSVTIDNVTLNCGPGQWRYEGSGDAPTTVTDFDLVCDKAYLNYLAGTLYFVGITMGGFVSGYSSDRFGRKRVVLANLYCLAALSLGIAFSNHYIVFTVLRVICGFFTMGLHTSTFILLVESFPVQHRTLAGTAIQIFWGVGVMYLASMLWILKNWRHVQLALLGPMAVSMIVAWFLPESLRWLLARSNTDGAHNVIKRFCRINHLSDPVKDDPSALNDFEVHDTKQSTSYLVLMRTPQMRKRVFSMGFLMFAGNMGYYGMTFNTSLLAGDRYLNFLLAAVTETIAYSIVTVFIVKFGRKKPLIAVLVSGAVCCIIAGVVPRGEDGKPSGTNGIVITVFSLIGRMIMAALFVVNDIYCAELFPTVVRNMAFGACQFAGRMGGVVAPQIFSLADVTFSQLPPIVCAVVSAIGVVLGIFLPETSGKPLPESIQDVETNFGKRTRRKSSLGDLNSSKFHDTGPQGYVNEAHDSGINIVSRKNSRGDKVSANVDKDADLMVATISYRL